MKQKGFTLVELLGVIVILGLLATIIYPVINKKIKTSKQELYKTQIHTIESGARNWGADHIGTLPINEGETVIVTLSELQNQGYVAENLENPKTGEPFSPDTTITIKMTHNSLEYEVEA